MPIQIDVYDFKCFNQLRNGENFDRNLSEFTPNLVGNVGETVKVEYLVNIAQSANTEGVDEWVIENDAAVKEIRRNSGSFLEDGIQIGDVYEFYSNWATRKNTGSASEYEGTVEFISNDGLTLKYSVNSGTDSTNGTVTNVGLAFDQFTTPSRNTALFVKFGLISNDETFNFLSKTTESEQVYYVGGLAPPSTEQAESLGVVKDWVSGELSVEFTNTIPDFKAAQYKITHIFVLNPFYILSYREFIENGTVPDLLAGESSIKYAAELEFRKTLTNTGSSKAQQFDGLGGFVGWYGENFNGLNADYQVVSVSYEEAVTGDPLDAININTSTKAIITVENINAAITAYSCSVYLFKVPNSEEDYIGTKTDLLENFLFKSEIVSSPDTSTPNVATSLVSGDLVIEYTIDYSTAEKLQLTTDDGFILLVQIEDPGVSVGNSDRIMLLADFRNYVDIDYLAEFIDVDTYTFLQHGQELAADPGQEAPTTSNEDGILLNAVIGANTARDVIINGITLKLLAYNPVLNKRFDLDEYIFNIGELLISGGVQQIEVDTTRGYILPVDDEFNLVRITTEGQVGDYRQYAIQIGQKIKWQDWIFNPNVDNVFFDAAQPNNNLNEKASNYSGEQGYQIKVALIINVSGVDALGRAVTGDFVQYGGDIIVNDYDESDDGVSGVIQTFDLETGNSLQGNILYNGKDTLFRAVFANAAAMQYGIHRIEPSQNQGDGIFEMSSLFLPSAGNLLKPLNGQTQLKYTLVGSDLTTECLIDGSRIQEGLSYKLSARVGVLPVEPVFEFQTNKNPSGASSSQNFNPSVVYGGVDTPLWIFENGYIHAGNSILDTDGSLTGLDGTAQVVGFYVRQPQLVTSFLNGQNGVLGTYDLTPLEGLTTISVDNNNVDNFDWFNRSDFVRLSAANNNLTGAYSISGCGFVSGDIDFSNNNISSFDISGVTGTVDNFNVRDNGLLAGAEDFDQLTFTSQCSINIGSTNYGACTFTQSCRSFNANGASTFSINASLITFDGSDCSINFGTTNVAWSSPTMTPGSTLATLNLNNTPSSGTYSDSWLAGYSTAANISLDNTSFTTFNLNTSVGNIFILSITGGSTTKTINLNNANLGRSSDGRFDFEVNGVSNFSATDNTYVIEGYVFTNSNGSFTLDLTNLDTDKPTPNSTLSISDLPNAVITLPNNVTKGILRFEMERTPTDGVSISTLGANALSVNNSSYDFKGACATAAEVNRVLVELDSIASFGFSDRLLDITGTNPAPDSSSGGNDGLTAAGSLVVKGFTVLTN